MSGKEEKESAGLTVKKEEDISQWYTQVIQKSGLADYSAVSGCIVFKPFSYSIWERIVREVDRRLKKMGVQNTYFPLFIPERLLKKEQAHVEGFSPEVAWVTHAGNTKLDERLAIRPTSETIMYESYKKWIRSWRDLPLRLNQWNNVVRWEFKHAVPFLRTREFLWNEGHTAFASKKEAEKECREILDMYESVVNEFMAVYGIKGKKTDKEKFAGAEYTTSLEFFLPSGKGIQGPDAHFDGQNFAKAFDIKYSDENEKEQYVWQNTWAITTRMIGIMIMMHGDDKGLVLPPKLSPTQVAIVPIIFKDSKEKVFARVDEVKKRLKEFRIEVDKREEYSSGWKFNEWELKGVPIRLEIGPKDVEKDQVVLVKRTTNEKMFVKTPEIENQVKKVLSEMHDELYFASKKFFEESMVDVVNMEEMKKAISEKKLARAFFCGDPEQEDNVKEQTGGASSRCMPFEFQGKKGKCVITGKETSKVVLFAKAY